MSIFEYIKQRWYLLMAAFIGGVFALIIYWTDGNGVLLYALEGIALCLAAFLAVDFFVLRNRVKKMETFLSGDDDTTSSYPLDKIYADMISRVVAQHKAYRKDMETQHAREIEFITKWVHDVKVPISALRLLTDGMDDELSAQLEMQTLYIEQNIQKILFHIKSKSFYEDYTIKPAGVRAMVSAALKQYAVFFSYKKIALRLDCADITVATDEKWSGYIISQIISNAVKYTPECGEIDIRAYRQGDTARISIKNTGEGIDPRSLKAIFKRGFSGSALRQGSATGYGLYLSKKLADIMGHGLVAESVPGECAVFTLVYNMTKM